MEGKYFSDVIDYDKHIKGKQLIEIVSGIGSGKTSWVRKLADMEIDGHKPSMNTMRISKWMFRSIKQVKRYFRSGSRILQ